MRYLKAEKKIRNRILLLLVVFSLPYLINAQSKNRTYLLKGTTNNATNCFQVVELTIHDDSSFTSITFGCGEKKDWRKYYKNWKTKFQNGKTTWDGNYYKLTEYRNGFKTKISWTVKITDKSVSYYHLNKKNKLKKTVKYKRVKLFKS